MGSGAVLDYDNNGWLDIYLLNGSTEAAMKGQEAPPRDAAAQQSRRHFCRCYRPGWSRERTLGFGMAVADYDNDGWPDVYVANYGKIVPFSSTNS